MSIQTSFALASLGAAITVALGALGLLAPARAAAFTSLAPVGKLGVSEIRATYGGLFAALGGACLLFQSLPMYQLAGLAWLGAALGRLLSAAVDRNGSAKNLGGIVFEAAIGTLLLAPTLAGTWQ